VEWLGFYAWLEFVAAFLIQSINQLDLSGKSRFDTCLYYSGWSDRRGNGWNYGLRRSQVGDERRTYTVNVKR
jgi:hypothetical protein